MHSPRVAAFLLGAWLVCSLGACLAAVGSFSAVDSALEKPSKNAEQVVAQLGQDRSRGLLEYLAAGEGAHVLLASEVAQAWLGLALAAALISERPTRLLSIGVVVMLLLAGFEHFFVTPDLGWLGQDLAFAPEGTSIAERGRLANLRHIYALTEAIKLLLGMGIAVFLFAMKSSGRRRRRSDLTSGELLEGRTVV